MNCLPVLIPDADQERALSVATCLARVPEVSLHAISEYQRSPLRFSRHCSSFQYCQHGQNDALWLEQIANAVKRTGAQVILPITIEGIEFASRRQDELRKLAVLTFVPQSHAFETTINKALFAQTLQAHGIPHPETIVMTLGDAFEAQLAHFTFPVLIKPMFGGGGAGIHVFHHREALFDFMQSHRDEVNGNYILQRFIPGHDIDCSLLSHEGTLLAYTVQRSAVQRATFTPAPDIEIMHDASVLKLATRLSHALQWSGVAHIDMRYNALTQQLEVIELNPRYWGSLLGSLVAGINFPHLACLAALGHSFPLPDYSDTRYMGEAEAIKQLWQACKQFRLPTVRYETLQFLLHDPLSHLVEAVGTGLGKAH